jgi:hypothetical protein
MDPVFANCYGQAGLYVGTILGDDERGTSSGNPSLLSMTHLMREDSDATLEPTWPSSKWQHFMVAFST